MSNIGKRLITLPENIEIKEISNYIFIKGKLGTQIISKPKGFNLEINNNKIKIIPNSNSIYSMWGTFRSSLYNTIIGLTNGFQIKMNLNGIGYKAEVIGNQLNLKLGYSNLITVEIPSHIKIEVLNQIITLSSSNIQKLKEFCSQLRRLRKVDLYKGKGLLYLNEKVYLKERKK